MQSTANNIGETPMNETCPICNGPGEFMGLLGEAYYFRCRDCGWQFSEELDDAPVPDADDFDLDWDDCYDSEEEAEMAAVAGIYTGNAILDLLTDADPSIE
jgi:rubredoxin